LWIFAHPTVDALLCEGAVDGVGHSWIEYDGQEIDNTGSEPLDEFYRERRVTVTSKWTLLQLIQRCNRLGLVVQRDGTLLKIGPDREGAFTIWTSPRARPASRPIQSGRVYAHQLA
jgi:hypothetical protein